MSSKLPLPPYGDRADRCIRPLCFAAAGDECYGLQTVEKFEAGSDGRLRNFQLGLQGTCTLILYREHYFVLFTMHQVAPVPHETLQEFQARMELVYVLMDDGHDSSNLPINAILSPTNGDGDEADFVVAVIEKAMLTDFMRAHFFPVTRASTGKVSDHALCSGFSSDLQQVLMQKDGLRTAAVCKRGVVVERMARSTALVEYTAHQRMDGMSGGAVFLLQLKDHQPDLFVDGIIQRARRSFGGRSLLQYLTIERILDRIDEYF